MGLKNDLLDYLMAHSDEYVSGEALAQIFGKSRAGVWKAIKSLQNQGYTIDAVTNKGYRFSQNNDVLNASVLEKGLDFDCRVEFYPSIDSTNTQAKRLINEGAADTMLVVAEQQTAGRGRQGKSFYSPAGTGIYMTLVIHPMTELQNAVTATTAASVAVCRAVESLTDKKPKIKWVNDVYIDDKKICGILTEAITDFETQLVSSVVIGIGINICTTDFPDDVQRATSLNVSLKRADLICAVANELNRLATEDYAGFIEYYRSHSMITGRDICFIKNGISTQAKAIGIDSRGGLEIQLQSGEKETLYSGDITIRYK